MKAAMVRKINSNPAYLRLFEWVKLVAVTGSAQAIIQAIGLFSGIFVIRMLPTHEYGLYTLANTMLGTMGVLSDGGISTGVMAQGGKVWNSREKLGAVLSTGFELRKIFSYISLIISIPILSYLLNRHDAGLIPSILIVVSIIPAFLATLSGTLLQIGLTLNQDVRPLQITQLWVSIFRFILLVIALFITPWAFVAILASAIPQIWGNIKVKALSFKYANWSMAPDLSIRKELLSFVKRILPGAIYFCLSGQITIWLISLFGSTNSVAQMGALGRLSMVLSIFSVMFATLIVPRFSRLPNNKALLLKRFLAIVFGLFILSLAIILLVYCFPEQILWVLGKDYSKLQNEVVLSIGASCLGLIAGSMFSLSTSRAWAINPFISIPISLAAILVGILTMDISSIEGVLKFNVFIMLVEVIMYLIYTVVQINKLSQLKAEGGI